MPHVGEILAQLIIAWCRADQQFAGNEVKLGGACIKIPWTVPIRSDESVCVWRVLQYWTLFWGVGGGDVLNNLMRFPALLKATKHEPELVKDFISRLLFRWKPEAIFLHLRSYGCSCTRRETLRDCLRSLTPNMTVFGHWEGDWETVGDDII
jgi:hypothetical protein